MLSDKVKKIIMMPDGCGYTVVWVYPKKGTKWFTLVGNITDLETILKRACKREGMKL